MKDSLVYARHIADRIENLENDVRDGKEVFFANATIQNSVLHNLQVIGEAAKHLPEELKQTYDAIPWSKVCGLRDVIVHDYMGITLDVIWKVIERDMPELKKTIDKIISNLENNA